MTVPVPRYARRKPVFQLWLAAWRFRRWRHGWRRNPACNEKRRYRDDTKFVVGEHTHVDPLVIRGGRWDGLEFDRVAVPFQLMRFNGPSDPDGLLVNWNWVDPEGS